MKNSGRWSLARSYAAARRRAFRHTLGSEISS
jgi:hypothetical protein